MGHTYRVRPGSARWKELVKIGIIAEGERNFLLGDVALEIAPVSEDSSRKGSEKSLHLYADEIGLAYGSLDSYRRVAAAWPPNERVAGTSWKVHQMLQGRKELIRPGMTVTEAHRALGHSTAGRTGPESPLEAQVRQVSGYSDEARRAIMRELVQDPDLAREAENAIDEVARNNRRQPAPTGIQGDTWRDKPEEMRRIKVQKAGNALNRGVNELGEAVRLIEGTTRQDMSGFDRELWTGALEQARNLLDVLDNWHDGRDVASEAERFLHGI